MAQICGVGVGVCPSWGRISLLEAENASLKRQLQVLSAEVSLIIECLGKNLGLSVVNTNSFYFKSLHGEGCSSEIDNIKRSLTLTLPKTNPNEGLSEKLLDEVAPINLTDHECVESPGSVDSAANVGRHFRGPEEDVDPGETDNEDSLDSTIVVQESGSENYGSPKVPGSSEIEAQPVNDRRPKILKKFPSMPSDRTPALASTDKIRKSKRIARPFKCQYCWKSFKKAAHNEEHERIHTGEKPHKCRFCDKMFGSTSGRVKHERTAHSGEKDNQYELKEFINLNAEPVAQNKNSGSGKQSSPAQHEGIHQRPESTKCKIPVAGAACVTQKNVQNRPATSEMNSEGQAQKRRIHKCQYCKAIFRTIFHQKQHERVHAHADEKPHKCKFCAKTFTTRAHRVQHEQAHSGEKPHNCGFCDKTFRTYSNLSSHLLHIHTNERAHACQLCEKKFATRAHLITHKKRNHQKQ